MENKCYAILPFSPQLPHFTIQKNNYDATHTIKQYLLRSLSLLLSTSTAHKPTYTQCLSFQTNQKVTLLLFIRYCRVCCCCFYSIVCCCCYYYFGNVCTVFIVAKFLLFIALLHIY